ncbi:DNA translocase FtsK [Enterobacter hormaechei]
MVNYAPGPVITRFELNLAPGVKAARNSNLSVTWRVLCRPWRYAWWR